MDAEMLRNVLTMLAIILGAILVLMLVAKITSMVHVEADDARAPIDSMEASVVGKRTLVTQEDGAPKTIYYMTFQKVNGMRMELEAPCCGISSPPWWGSLSMWPPGCLPR